MKLSSLDKTIIEMLEPLVYDEMKVGALIGGRNAELCQSKLYEARYWLRDYWKEDENIKTDHVGKYSVWFNIMSKNLILYYALKGYRVFADSQKGEGEQQGERLMKMAIKAHAFELGADFAKPRVILVDPLRINIQVVSSFQRADDLFANPDKYIIKDKEGKAIIEKSGWLPSKEENMSPIFMWMVSAAYETNLFSLKYFTKAQKLAKGEDTDDRDASSNSTDRN